MDTGIIIRTAHIKQGKLSYRAGATLLYDSDPKAEIEETENKSRAFLDTFC
jgi:anthranilate synthase